jgi:hypothetical protein
MKIDDLTLQDSLSKSLRHLNSLAKILKKRRIENGYVILQICIRAEHDFLLFNSLIGKCNRFY